MSKKIKIPADLGIKLISPEEELWTNIKKGAEKNILQAHADIEVGEVLVELANKKLEEFKERGVTCTQSSYPMANAAS